ncbi:MAG: radical SAM protein, partial [Chloroflexota bacterium]
MANNRQPVRNPRVLLLTGFAPMELAQLDEMGIETAPFLAMASVMGKDTFQLTIPCIGAVAVATYLRDRGVDVRIKDFFLDDLSDCDGDIIGISSTFMGPSHVKEIASFARERNPSSIIVLGGPLSWSFRASSLLDSAPAIDFVSVGEGEQTFLELLEALALGAEPREVLGIVSRHDNGHPCGERRPSLDAELIPTPDWGLLAVPNPRRLPVLPVETSRGCPYSCPYCSETHYWGKPPRYRRPEAVAVEIARNVRDFGITSFRFTDSCFSAPPKRCAEVCDAIYHECTEAGLPVTWSSYARVSNLSPRLLEKMKRSGCIALDIGVESGDPATLRRMGRRYSPERAVTVAQEARRLGIITNFNIVVGFPGETVEGIERTIEMLDRAQPDSFACFLLFIAPNMGVSSYPDRYGLTGVGLSWYHSTMTSDEALEAMNKISKSVTGSCSFPGGEYFACYLASLGHSSQEIRAFFKAAVELGRGSQDPGYRSILEGVCTKLDAVC